jgi:hypothetical protein
LIPNTPLRTVTRGLWSTRTAARMAPKAVSPSTTMSDENVMKIVSRLSGRSFVTMTWAPVPWAWMVMGAPNPPWTSSTSKPL